MKLTEETLDAITEDLQQGHNPFLAGPVGVGKSEVLTQITERLGGTCFVVDCGLMSTKEDFTGVRTRKAESPAPGDPEHEQYFVPHVDLARAIRHANANPDETVVVVLDEINRVDDPGVTNAATAVFLQRRVGDTPLPKNVRMSATGNVHGHVVDLDEAAVSRMSLREIDPDAVTWMTFMENAGREVIGDIRDVLTRRPELIWAKGASAAASTVSSYTSSDDAELLNRAASAVAGRTREILQITCPRTITALNTRLLSAGDEKLKQWDLLASSLRDGRGNLLGLTFLEEIVRGYVGNTPFAADLIETMRERLNPPITAQLNPVGQPAERTEAVERVLDATDTDEVLDITSEMTIPERDEVLIYLLEASGNNPAVLTALGNAYDVDETVGSTTRKAISERIIAELINLDNLRAFTSARTPVADTLRDIYEALAGEQL